MYGNIAKTSSYAIILYTSNN